MEFLNSLFLPMLAGHLISDFWLQPASWIEQKKEKGWKSGKMFLHATITAILPVLFAFQIRLWWYAPVIFVTHYLIDAGKSKFKDTIPGFLIDQTLHIAVLFLLSLLAESTGTGEPVVFWVYFTGFILVTHPFGIFTGMFLKSVTKNNVTGVKLDASAWIGILERILIVIFVVTSQFQAIGFLVAAKSIFRFNDTQQDGTMKAEYFLLGTMISFTLAILTGLAIRWLADIPQL